ncbi:hypothetical protein PPSIR1_21244 [Plesiocystis pacifica SIR-1]|uniref:Uncharacterized protein n=1 Tax=Plesiocystis pacifica SIR-1 TaxID=391625 RepID=A6G3I8_9BACT|nr:hypothetical protein [Plesiocystis pacifica]EDM79595.1 hypothetical protein PPSIR1_21244 [Plesiocystis pacifica SIR-1]
MSESGVPSWVWWTLGASALGGLGLALVKSAPSPGYDILLRRTGELPDAVHTLAALQRYTESRGNSLTGLGKVELFPAWAKPRQAPRDQQVAEAKAAATAYDRNAEAYADSPHPRYMWVFGSGGAYGLLPANALAPWKGTQALMTGRVSPYDVFSPWKSTVFFLEYVRRLIARDDFRRLPDSAKTVLTVKRGMASPALMADIHEAKARSRTTRRNCERACEALGLAKSVLERRVPEEWPKYRGAALIP